MSGVSDAFRAKVYRDRAARSHRALMATANERDAAEAILRELVEVVPAEPLDGLRAVQAVAERARVLLAAPRQERAL